MPEIDGYPRLERLSDEERARFVEFFRGKTGPNVEFREDPPRFHFYDATETGALSRTQDLITSFCRETGIDRERIQQGLLPPDKYRPKT